MPGSTFERKKYRYDQTALDEAIQSIMQKKMSYKKAFEIYGVPKSTLADRCTGKRPPTMPHKGPKPALSQQEEEALKRWMLQMASRGLPVAKCQVLQTVKQLLDLSGRKVTFFHRNLPGNAWWNGFLARHPEVCSQTSKKLRTLQAKLTPSETVRDWFGQYQAVVNDNSISDPKLLYSCHEIEFQLKSGKLVVDSLKMSSHHILSGYKSQITVLVCIRADGYILPPYVLFPGKSLDPSHVADLPAGANSCTTENGWMTEEAFDDWMTDSFIPHLAPLDIRPPVMLLLDSRSSHNGYRMSLVARDNNIILCGLAPFSPQLVQPVHQGFFKPFKAIWKEECEGFVCKSRAPLNKMTFGRVFREAFCRTPCSVSSAQAFKSCGLWPVDENAFKPPRAHSSGHSRDPKKAKILTPDDANDHPQTLKGFADVQTIVGKVRNNVPQNPAPNTGKRKGSRKISLKEKSKRPQSSSPPEEATTLDEDFEEIQSGKQQNFAKNCKLSTAGAPVGKKRRKIDQRLVEPSNGRTIVINLNEPLGYCQPINGTKKRSKKSKKDGASTEMTTINLETRQKSNGGIHADNREMKLLLDRVQALEEENKNLKERLSKVDSFVDAFVRNGTELRKSF